MQGAHTRLTLSDTEEALLRSEMGLFSRACRQTYQQISTGQTDLSTAYKALRHQGVFTSHQVKSILSQVEQWLTTDKETLVYRISQLELRIQKQADAVADLDKKMSSASQKFSKPAAIQKIKSARFQKNRSLCNAQNSLRQLKDDLAKNQFHRVFGGKKLLQQRGLCAKDSSPWATPEDWKTEWNRKRSGTLLALGCGSDTAGNITAQLDVVNKTLTLRLSEHQAKMRLQAEAERLGVSVDKVPGKLQFKRLTLHNVAFCANMSQKLQYAQQLGLPITVSLQQKHTPKSSGSPSKTKKQQHSRSSSRKNASKTKAKPHKIQNKTNSQSVEHGFYMHASFNLPAATLVTSRRQGVLGVDVNAWGLAWCITTPDGNVSKDAYGVALKGNTPLQLKHLTSNQARSAVLKAVQELVSLAEQHNVALACEDLEFSKKKAGLREQSAAYARMLSGLKTSGFKASLASRCQKQGIPLHVVNPSWTSVSGYAKYGLRNALSLDQAAAFAVARKALRGKHPNTTAIPTHSAAGKKLQPSFIRQLEAQRASRVVQYHESVKFAQPLPAKLQRKLGGHSALNHWRTVQKVLGSRSSWPQVLSGRSAKADLNASRLVKTQTILSRRVTSVASSATRLNTNPASRKPTHSRSNNTSLTPKINPTG